MMNARPDFSGNTSRASGEGQISLWFYILGVVGLVAIVLFGYGYFV